MNIKFKEWDCQLEFGYYQNGRPAIELIDTEDGQPIATATVNIPDYPLLDNEMFIKDYSENEGMLEALVKAEIVVDTGKRITQGFVTIPIVTLNNID